MRGEDDYQEGGCWEGRRPIHELKLSTASLYDQLPIANRGISWSGLASI